MRAQPELFRDDLREHGADAGADVLHARQDLDRAVAQQAHFAGCVGLHIGAPQRLRHADAALDRAGIRARRMTAAPADPFGAAAAFLAPHRARIDAIAQHQRIDRQLFRQFIDDLFERERAWRIARAAHRAAGAGIDEDVVLLDIEIRALVHRLRDIADAGADGRSRRAIGVERDRAERAVLARADLQPLECSRAVARVELFLVAIEHEPDRRAGGTRKGDCRARVIAGTRFRSESAAHRIDDNPDPIARQIEGISQLVAHAGGELGREIDRQPVRPPIGDDGMRFHAAMRLHLRAVFAFDDDVGFGEALLHVAARSGRGGTAHVSVLLKLGRSGHAAGEAETDHRRTKDRRSVDLAGFFDVDNERQHLVFDLDQAQRCFRGLRRRGRDRRDRRPDIKSTRYRPGGRPGFDRTADNVGDNVNGAHIGMAFRRFRIDRYDARMRMRRAQQPAMQHARQLDIDREARGAGHLGPAIDPRHRLADHRSADRSSAAAAPRRREPVARFRRRKHRRFRMEPVPPHWFFWCHVQPLLALAAASVAANTCG